MKRGIGIVIDTLKSTGEGKIAATQGLVMKQVFQENIKEGEK